MNSETLLYQFEHATAPTLNGTGAVQEDTEWLIRDNVLLRYGGHHNVYTLQIPEGVKVIGAGAFENCRGIIRFELPEGIEKICAHAFRNCRELSQINLPRSLQIIMEGAFENCTSLKDITITSGIRSIGRDAFAGCTELTSVDMEEGIRSLGEGSFRNCTNLQDVCCSSSLQEIGSDAFQGTSWINSASPRVINGMLISLGTWVHEPIIPNNTERILSRTFSGVSCHAIHLPSSVTRIDPYAFAYSDVKRVQLPTAITEIPEGAFAFSSLTELTIPEHVTSIGPGAFQSCHSLESISIPAGVKEFSGDAFQGTPWFAKQKENDQLLIINSVLVNWSGKSEVLHIPDQVRTIAHYAFCEARYLSRVYVPRTVQKIYPDSFLLAGNEDMQVLYDDESMDPDKIARTIADAFEEEKIFDFARILDSDAPTENSMSESQPESKPTPEPEPQPAPQPQPAPRPQPAPQPQPAPEPQTIPQPQVETVQMLRGQRLPLPRLQELCITFSWSKNPGCVEPDVSAFVLGDNGKVLGDEWLVFYGQDRSPDGAVHYELQSGNIDGKAMMSVDLSHLDPRVKKIDLTLTLYDSDHSNFTFGAFRDIHVTIRERYSTHTIAEFNVEGYGANNKSIIALSIYYKNPWTINAMGYGFDQNMAEKLCKMYGVNVG